MFPQVICTISPGFLDSEWNVCIQDTELDEHYLRVSKGMINETADGKYFLPIGIVRIDRKADRVLIELPHEADNGTYRLWVKLDQLDGMEELVS